MTKVGKKSSGSVTNKLKEIYGDVKNPAGFGGAQKLADAAGVSLERTNDYLRGVDAYTLHKEKRRNFSRNRYVVPRMHHLYEADLCDMQRLQDKNNGVTFLLNCIDCFSKFLWCIPVKNKKAETILKAFREIYKTQVSMYLQTDEGKEFDNNLLKKFLKSKNIKLIIPKSGSKCNIVERVNKTIKAKIFKYMTHKGTEKYIDVLSDIVSGYNNSKHSSTGHKPAEVTKDNENAVWDMLYEGHGRYAPLAGSAEPRKNLRVGTFVRIARALGTFAKAYEGNWTHEIFKIVKIVRKPQTLYELQDLKQKSIEGRFNYFELQKVNFSDKSEFRIDKILKRVGKGNSRRLLVSWVGYSAEHNSYIYEKDLKKL
jgi:hypothetical protein